MLVIGVLAFSGSGGTFASFNAVTTNPGNSISSGTLTLSDQVHSGTMCLSSGGPVGNPANNANPTCTAIVTVQNVAPGSWDMSTQTAKVTIEDTGSLNASTFTLSAPTHATCAGSKSTSAPHVTVSTVTVASGSPTATAAAGSFSRVRTGMLVFALGVPAGTTVTAVGSTSVTMSQNATATKSESVNFGWSTTVAHVQFTSGQKTITVTGGNGFPGVAVGMTVSATGTPVPTSTIVTAIAGTTITISQAATATATKAVVYFGATSGRQNNFTSTPSPTYPFCHSALLYVQESATVGANTDYYCWYGYNTTGTGTTESATTGLCAAPLVTTTTGSITCASATSITLTAATGPIYHNDLITVTSAGTTCTLKAGATYKPSTSSTVISVTHTSGSGTFPSGSAVSDSTVAGHLNSDHTHTVATFISRFKHTIGKIVLYPITGPGAITKRATVQLGALSSRSFTIGLYVPKLATTQNTVQGLKTIFGLTWYISQ